VFNFNHNIATILYDIRSILIQPGDNRNFDCLIECSHACESNFIFVPVQTDDGLLSQNLFVQPFDAADNAFLDPVFVFLEAFVGLTVLVEIHGPIARHHTENVAVLGQVAETPKRALGRFTLQFGEAVLRVVRAHVEYVLAALERADCEFVHLAVFAVELQVADAILQVGVPDEHVLLEVEYLQVPVILATRQCAFVLCVTVAEGHRPAIGHVLALRRLQL